MLVMRRRAGDSLLIGEDIEVEILEISHNRVKLGIVAPAAVPVIRKELILTREANLSASRTVPARTINWLTERLAAPPVPKASTSPNDCQ